MQKGFAPLCLLPVENSSISHRFSALQHAFINKNGCIKRDLLTIVIKVGKSNFEQAENMANLPKQVRHILGACTRTN